MMGKFRGRVAGVAMLPHIGRVSLLRETTRAGLAEVAHRIARLLIKETAASSEGLPEVAAIGILLRDSEMVARAAETAVEVGGPDEVETWLTLALSRSSDSDVPGGLAALRTAGALGLPSTLLSRLQAHLEPLGQWSRR